MCRAIRCGLWTSPTRPYSSTRPSRRCRFVRLTGTTRTASPTYAATAPHAAGSATASWRSRTRSRAPRARAAQTRVAANDSATLSAARSASASRRSRSASARTWAWRWGPITRSRGSAPFVRRRSPSGSKIRRWSCRPRCPCPSNKWTIRTRSSDPRPIRTRSCVKTRCAALAPSSCRSSATRPLTPRCGLANCLRFSSKSWPLVSPVSPIKSLIRQSLKLHCWWSNLQCSSLHPAITHSHLVWRIR